MNASLRVLLAGGGTAGHVNPLLAVAADLQAGGAHCEALGTATGLEANLIPAEGITLHEVPRVPFPRRPSLDLLKLPNNLRKAVAAAGKALTDSRADVAVGFGGYVSTPLYLAARKRGIPLVIHEQNARPGMANRLGARWAAAVALTFSSTPLVARRGVTETTGLPLRPEIVSLARDRTEVTGALSRREQAAARFQLDPKRPILVITGGSSGALHINECVVAAVPELPSDLQVLHLTGKGKDQLVRDAVQGRNGYVVLDYLRDMEEALAVADLVLCRSGAGTVAELAALGLPAYFVPLPIGNGEQRLNANNVVQAGGAQIISNSDFSSRTVVDQILPLLQSSETLDKMSRAAVSCGKIEASAAVADLVRGVAK